MSPNIVNLKLDLRIVCVVLLVIIGGMLAAWRPWQPSSSVTRKITVSGEATIKAVPDEYVFSPYFERSGSKVDSMKAELNTYGAKLLADLKKLGVKEDDVKLDSSSYDDYNYYSTSGSSATDQTINLQVTIAVASKGLAQKVQDYLAGTDAKGQLTAQAQFSESKKKQLESTARQQAVADARKKAGQTAANLEAKIGKVLEINDGGYSDIRPLTLEAGADTSTKSSLPVTPGKNQVTASVQVVFALR